MIKKSQVKPKPKKVTEPKTREVKPITLPQETTVTQEEFDEELTNVAFLLQKSTGLPLNQCVEFVNSVCETVFEDDEYKNVQKPWKSEKLCERDMNARACNVF